MAAISFRRYQGCFDFYTRMAVYNGIQKEDGII
jgi:hypothetical protein